MTFELMLAYSQTMLLPPPLTAPPAPPGGAVELDELDATATLAAATDNLRARRLAEVEELLVVLHWADLHSEDPREGPDGEFQRSMGNVLVQLGGDGTPGVQDFCLGELAIARGTGVVALRNLMADLLDLRHRLPLIWSAVRAGECESWVAGKVARLSRALPADRVGLVDSAIARIITRESAGRVIEVAEAKVIEADQDAHAARLEEARRQRFAHVGRSDEHGLRTLVARVTAGDAAAIDAVITRVAEILRPLNEEATSDELRAEAIGYLARPTELLRLLLEHLEPPEQQDEQPEGEPEPELPRALAFPADLLDALRSADLSALRPRSVLYVHLHEAAVGDRADAVARAEGLGPVLVNQLEELLRHHRVTLTPVIDLNDRVSTAAYEHPESLKTRVHLMTGGDYFPFAAGRSRRVDYDHPTPYDPDGPPGQTGDHNSGPLTRTHHRWKTHAGYRARQSGQGRYAWLTPQGRGYLVDHTGTREIDPEHARMIIEAPAGVDIYPGGPEIDITGYQQTPQR